MRQVSIARHNDAFFVSHHLLQLRMGLDEPVMLGNVHDFFLLV
jgi:hypothetical protein